MMDLASLTIAQAVTKIRAGEIAPSELVESCILRTECCDGDVQAWVHTDPDMARMAARLLDPLPATRRLHGIPFGVKDIIETADMPTGYGTPIFHNHRSARDAASVALLKEAGGIVFGKTVTTELAHFHPGKTRNPHNMAHTPGGSSSGSAAAVAAGMVPFALGTQTTGSVLRPASYCGVFGYKPSFGDVSRSGVFECVASFDTVGWFTRSVDDVEIVRRALLRLPEEGPTNTNPGHANLADVDLAKVRIAFFRPPWWDQAEPHTRDLLEGAVKQLERAGAKLVDVAAPVWLAEIAEWHRQVAGFEFARAITFERMERSHQLSPKLVEGRCGDGLALSYDDYTTAQAGLVRARSAYASLATGFDVLLTPAAPGEAWHGLAATGDPVFNTAWTALHVPALSVPAFKGPSGLPVGLQIVGRYREDAGLLAASKAICRALGCETVAAAAPSRS